MTFTETAYNATDKSSLTDGKHYDDVMMRKAVENVKKSGNFNRYNACTNNCQDFTQAVKEEYKRLGGK